VTAAIQLDLPEFEQSLSKVVNLNDSQTTTKSLRHEPRTVYFLDGHKQGWRPLTDLPIHWLWVTAWQSVNAICHYHLSLPFVIFAWLTVPRLKSLDQSLLATATGSSACQNIQQECFHLSMSCPHDLQCVLDMHVASQAWLKFLQYTCILFCVIFCGLRLCYVSHIPMTAMCIQHFHIQHVHHSGSPTMSCIHLVIIVANTLMPSSAVSSSPQSSLGHTGRLQNGRGRVSYRMSDIMNYWLIQSCNLF